jgi:hypothetical protein
MNTAYCMNYFKNESKTLLRLISISLLLIASTSKAEDDDLIVAERMLDTFYHFDSQALSRLLEAGEDADRVLYYQAWAEAANYRIKDRSACELNDEMMIVCSITVFDDFGKTLDYTATDTFYLTVKGDKVVAARFEGDDPMIFTVLFLWIKVFRSEIFEDACKDMFEGGDTPAECSKAVVQAARDFTILF